MPCVYKKALDKYSRTSFSFGGEGDDHEGRRRRRHDDWGRSRTHPQAEEAESI